MWRIPAERAGADHVGRRDGTVLPADRPAGAAAPFEPAARALLKGQYSVLTLFARTGQIVVNDESAVPVQLAGRRGSATTTKSEPGMPTIRSSRPSWGLDRSNSCPSRRIVGASLRGERQLEAAAAAFAASHPGRFRGVEFTGPAGRQPRGIDRGLDLDGLALRRRRHDSPRGPGGIARHRPGRGEGVRGRLPGCLGDHPLSPGQMIGVAVGAEFAGTAHAGVRTTTISRASSQVISRSP